VFSETAIAVIHAREDVGYVLPSLVTVYPEEFFPLAESGLKPGVGKVSALYVCLCPPMHMKSRKIPPDQCKTTKNPCSQTDLNIIAHFDVYLFIMYYLLCIYLGC
jgi:hypothetical protein